MKTPGAASATSPAALSCAALSLAALSFAALSFTALSLAPLPLAAAPVPLPGGMAGRLIEHYHMQPIPQEGAWFSLSYASDDQLAGEALPPRYAGRARLAGNAIVVVATPADFSAMHRLQSDEVWHFYGGSALDMLLLYPDGLARKVTLGADVLAGEYRQFTVPHGVWQGAAPRESAPGAYSFAGTQLSPGFDAADFEMGYRDELIRSYPGFARDIERLTRAGFASRAPVAPAAPAVAFFAGDIPPIALSAGVDLRELVGRVAPDARTGAVSVAQFTLAPGHGSGTSYNRQAQEVFVVTAGTGRVHLGERVTAVTAGSTVFIPAALRHSIEADADSTLVFYAVCAPAFTPEDYVPVPP